MTARYIFHAQGPEDYTDPAQAKRCIPTLRFLRGDAYLKDHRLTTLPHGLAAVLNGGNADGGIYGPKLIGPDAYDRNMAALWNHPSHGVRENGLDWIILERDVRPRTYAQLAELFDCDLSEVCAFAVEAHAEYSGAKPAGFFPCSYGGCHPWSTYVGERGIVRYPERWATMGGLGMMRIKSSLPARHPRADWPEGGDWRSLDARFVPWLCNTFRLKVHVHWDEDSPTKMVTHHHGKCVGEL